VLGGATEWLDSSPRMTVGLRGHIVLVDLATYDSCIN
jgi:hypothetical protein